MEERGSAESFSFVLWCAARSNKIYKCDAVFLIEKSQYKRPKPNAVSLYAPARSNKTHKCDAVFRIEKAKANDISQTQFP